MKLYKLAIIDVREEEGHVSIPQMKDFVAGFLTGFSAIELQRHLKNCPICENNHLELLHKHKNENLHDCDPNIDNSFLDNMNFLEKDPREK